MTVAHRRKFGEPVPSTFHRRAPIRGASGAVLAETWAGVVDTADPAEMPIGSLRGWKPVPELRAT